MSYLTKFRKRTMALVLATSLMSPAAIAWSQAASQPGASEAESTGRLDMDLAQGISEAWSEGKDASGAVAFEENGEIALSEGDKQRARRDFEAGERELVRLHPNPVGVPSVQ
jgi:CubicO group peptidase (beta-lactamase class C family)